MKMAPGCPLNEQPSAKIRGLNHITLSVRELNRSLVFYTEILGARVVARWPRGAYLQAGDLWLALIVDENVRQASLDEYSHTAFTVAAKDFAPLKKCIINSGATIWKENLSPGASVYFLDPDGHKLEIHTGNLESRLAAAKEDAWDGLELMD
jgi:catechol 2,3-dioxygenase-like lactoylglutathione lyase family enzyme